MMQQRTPIQFINFVGEIVTILAIHSFLILVLIGISFAASFDCEKAKTAQEKMICSDSALSSIDDKLAQSYKAAMWVTNSKRQFIAQQKEWLSAVRNKCETKSCLVKVYKERINELVTFKNEAYKAAADKEKLMAPLLRSRLDYEEKWTSLLSYFKKKKDISQIIVEQPLHENFVFVIVYDEQLKEVNKVVVNVFEGYSNFGDNSRNTSDYDLNTGTEYNLYAISMGSYLTKETKTLTRTWLHKEDQKGAFIGLIPIMGSHGTRVTVEYIDATGKTIQSHTSMAFH